MCWCVDVLMCCCCIDVVDGVWMCWYDDVLMTVLVLWWGDVLMYWCVDVLMYWCVDVLIYWCICVLMCWCVDVLMCWCVDVLMCWCVDGLMDWWIDVLMTVLMYWCCDQVMDWCIDVLICWCIDMSTCIGVLVTVLMSLWLCVDVLIFGTLCWRLNVFWGVGLDVLMPWWSVLMFLMLSMSLSERNFGKLFKDLPLNKVLSKFVTEMSWKRHEMYEFKWLWLNAIPGMDNLRLAESIFSFRSKHY